ncbi:MAG: type II secretion system F family protein [Defluviitaleaceae bacterium]|nr:type II secretion system F family protein [Defluviitaleaceae bacterium]
MPILPPKKPKKRSFRLYSRKPSKRVLAVFCRKLAFLLDAGISLKEALPMLGGQRNALGAAVKDLHKMILQGESLSLALKSAGVFPAFMCGYVAVGEHVAQLAEVFTRLADYYDAKAKNEEELTAAMVYPLLVSAMMLGVLVMAVTFVLPGYSRIFDASGVALPRFTLGLLAAADFFAANRGAVLCGFLGFLLAMSFFLRSRLAHFAALKIPIFRQNINRNLSQVLALLLSSGLNISAAVPLCGEVLENSVIRADLKKLAAKISSGVAFCDALGELSYVEPILVELARVGEESGSFASALQKCSEYLEESHSRAVRRVNKLIEPVVTLVLGVVLGVVMLAIILPTFQLAVGA